MRPGDRLYPDTNAEGRGVVLRYQSDGNVVLYDRQGAIWAADVSAAAGYLEMQHDGNLVAYDAAGTPYWASDTYAPGATLEIARTGLRIVSDGAVVWEVGTGLEAPPVVSTPGSVRQIQGQVRVIRQSFGDASGPRIIHGCSDFGAIRKMYQDGDAMLRQLDVVAQHQQYVRVLWRLNGRPWDRERDGWTMTVDPLRHLWFEDVALRYFRACHDRGIRLNLSIGDMFNWTASQAEQWFTRVAQMAASVSPDLVWLCGAVNEMRGTTPGGESDDALRQLEHLMRVWATHYPWGMRSISDPGSQDKAGMKRLSGGNSTCALIHDVRWSVPDALRRCFNSAYENYPGKPVVQDEPTGPNGMEPPPFGQQVYQPVNDEDDLLAIYTMHVITGQASTYFGDSSLIDRQPLEANWGFKEIPAFWRSIELPEDIGQGQLYHGGRAECAMNVIDSNADRADGCVAPDGRFFGVISGERGGWKVKSRWDAHFTAWTARGVVADQRVSVGEQLPVSGTTPTVVRFVR